MSELNPKEIFDTLNASHHLIYEYELFTTPIAESWNLGGLFSTFSEAIPKSYKDEDKFRKILALSTPKSVYSRKPSRLKDIVSTNIPRFTKGDELNTEISRYAAWALMKYLGENMIIQQEYFLLPGQDGNFDSSTEHFHAIMSKADQTVRIPWRANVTRCEKEINGILGTFNRGMPLNDRESYFTGLRRDINKILYDQKPVSEIRQEYNMCKNNGLADYMDRHLLYAYYNMLRRTIRDWRDTKFRQTYPRFVNIALENAEIARTSFRYGATNKHFTNQAISEIKSDRNKREIAFAKKYGLSH